MNKVKFGPAGLGSVKDAIKNLEEMHKLGITACEISFTYGPYIKEEECKKIKETAEKFNIQLSIHAQYLINLNSEEPKKIEMSKKRILACCKIGELLGVKYVVFHPGYYGKGSKEKAFENIKKNVLDILKEIEKNKWKIKIAVETMGKVNVFGSIEEIKKLVKETGCEFCLDFAHLLARSNGKMTYEEMVKEFKEFKIWNCHFSGIVYGDKGEKHHKVTPKEELKKLLKTLPKNKEITIINESPEPLKDSVEALKIWESS